MIQKFALFGIAIICIWPELDYLRAVIAAGCLALVVPETPIIKVWTSQ